MGGLATNDLGDYLNQKRIQDAITAPNVNLPDKMPDMTVHVNHFLGDPNDTAPNGDTVVPPVASKTPYQDAYRRSLENIPEYQEPSTLRKVLSTIAGMGVGAFAGADKGLATHQRLENAPNEEAMKPYLAKQGAAKVLSDLEAQQQKADLEQRKGESQINEQGATTQLTQGQYRNLAPSYEQSIEDRDKLEKDRLAATEGKNYEVEYNDGTRGAVHEDPNGVMRKVDPTKTDGVGEVVSWSAIKNRSQPHGSIKEATAPKTPFELWMKQNPEGKAEEWIGEQSKKTQNEYNDFREGVLAKNPNTPTEEIARRYAEMQGAAKPPQQLMVPTGGGAAQLVRPGTNVSANMETPQQLGGENTSTGTTKTMRETAPNVEALADKVLAGVQEQKNQLGPAASRWNEFWAGKAGAPNPGFIALRTNNALLQTLLMRMHVGASGRVALLQHFQDLFDLGKQSPENMEAAVGEIKNYAHSIANEKAGGTPEPKATKQYNPATGKIEDIK